MRITADQEMRYLRDVALFRNLKPEELKMISLITENCVYEGGEVIVSEGDEGDEAYVIYSGQAEVYRASGEGRAVSLNMLGPGESFGELALFGEGLRTASVRATVETLVGVIPKSKLYEAIRAFPDIAIEMLRVQTRRFCKVENRLMGLIGNKG